MGALPWSQVGDAFALAPKLSALLGVSRLEALGILVQLEREALEVADFHFRGARGAILAAGSIGWPAERAGELAQALADLGKADITDGVKMLGMEWAIRALQERDKTRERVARLRANSVRTANVRRTNGVRTPNELRTYGECTPKVRPLDLDQETSFFAGADAPPPRPEDHVLPAPTSGREDELALGSEQAELLEVPAEPPKKRERKPPKPSRQQEIFRRMQEARERSCEEEGVACHMEDENPRKVNAMFARWKDTTTESPEMDELNGAFGCYLNNERFREQGWPVWLFMSGTVYAQHVRLWQGEDAA